MERTTFEFEDYPAGDSHNAPFFLSKLHYWISPDIVQKSTISNVISSSIQILRRGKNIYLPKMRKLNSKFGRINTFVSDPDLARSYYPKTVLTKSTFRFRERCDAATRDNKSERFLSIRTFYFSFLFSVFTYPEIYHETSADSHLSTVFIDAHLSERPREPSCSAYSYTHIHTRAQIFLILIAEVLLSHSRARMELRPDERLGTSSIASLV